MRKIFLASLGLVAFFGCNKLNVPNTIENVDYSKMRNSAVSDESTPSQTLESWLLNNGYDTNGNGTLDRHELQLINRIEAQGKGITDVSILESLPNLKILNLSGNRIEVANIKATGLEELNISNNKLIKLNISLARRLTDKIDVTGNPNLKCIQVDAIQRAALLNTARNFKFDNALKKNDGKPNLSLTACP